MPRLMLALFILTACNDPGGTEPQPASPAHAQAPGLVSSIAQAPVGPDGLVAGSPTDFVIDLDVSLDPAVSGYTLLAGRSIRVTLPDAFVSDGRPLQQFPCPVVTTCNTVALLQGWPQQPIPFPQYALSYEGTNAVVITANQDLVPLGTQNPGLKQIHLILFGFTNPGPGRYQISVEAEVGPGGAPLTGMATAWISPDIRPSINVLTLTPDNPPPRRNTIYQETVAGAATPLPFSFLLWDRDGEPMLGVSLVQIDDRHGRLLQEGRTIGQVFIQGPVGGAGTRIFSEAPSSPTTAPVTGFGAGLLRVHFRTGSAPGEYTVRFELAGGNQVRMFIRANAAPTGL